MNPRTQVRTWKILLKLPQSTITNYLPLYSVKTFTIYNAVYFTSRIKRSISLFLSRSELHVMLVTYTQLHCTLRRRIHVKRKQREKEKLWRQAAEDKTEMYRARIKKTYGEPRKAIVISNKQQLAWSVQARSGRLELQASTGQKGTTNI